MKDTKVMMPIGIVMLVLGMTLSFSTYLKVFTAAGTLGAIVFLVIGVRTLRKGNKQVGIFRLTAAAGIAAGVVIVFFIARLPAIQEFMK